MVKGIKASFKNFVYLRSHYFISSTAETLSDMGNTNVYNSGENLCSAYKAGKYYIKGSRQKADAEFAQTKVQARNFGKLMAVGLLTVGPVKLEDQEKKEAKE